MKCNSFGTCSIKRFPRFNLAEIAKLKEFVPIDWSMFSK